MEGGGSALDFGFKSDMVYFSKNLLIFSIELGDLSMYGYFTT
jgi:hypothetical protein